MMIQEGGFPRCRNMIIGDIENAKVVLTAHYDTGSFLRFPGLITPKNPMLSILFMLIPAFAAVLLLGWLLNLVFDSLLLALIVCLGLLILVTTVLAIQCASNDNTTGVIALCELLSVLTTAERSKAAFVFFDRRGSIMTGSVYFRAKYKKQLADKLLINFDCASAGDNILVSASKAARADCAGIIKDCFLPTQNKAILFAKAENIYYPSDQVGFKKTVAVAVLKHKRFIGYCMDRTRVWEDTVLDKENIKLLCESIHRLLMQI